MSPFEEKSKVFKRFIIINPMFYIYLLLYIELSEMKTKKTLIAKQKRIAKERIQILFDQADNIFKKNPSLANRYVTLARKLSMKAKVRIPSNLKRKFCKHCYKYLKPSVNARIRTQKGKLVYYCLNCKKFTRIPLKKKLSK